MDSSEDSQWQRARDIATAVERVHNHLVSSLAEDIPIPEVTPRQVILLFFVRDRSGASIKELAGLLRVTPSSVSTMVDRLVEGGMLTREQNPGDRREVMVRISPEFEKTLEPLERRALQALVKLIDQLGPDMAEKWWSISLRVLEILNEEEQRALSMVGRHTKAVSS